MRTFTAGLSLCSPGRIAFPHVAACGFHGADDLAGDMEPRSVSSRDISSGRRAVRNPQERTLQIGVLDSCRCAQEFDDACALAGQATVALERQQHMGRPTAVRDDHRSPTGGMLRPSGVLVELATGVFART